MAYLAKVVEFKFNLSHGGPILRFLIPAAVYIHTYIHACRTYTIRGYLIYISAYTHRSIISAITFGKLDIFGGLAPTVHITIMSQCSNELVVRGGGLYAVIPTL